MAYSPDWELLADALKRVMATRVTEDEAKTDLCNAVRDGKIGVQVRIAASDGMRGQIFSNGNVRVPAHLSPSDFDWVQSRPLQPWPIGPKLVEHYFWSGGWENRSLDLIELSTADVTTVLCGGGGANNKAEKLTTTSGQESVAIKALALHLQNNRDLIREDAATWCREQGFKLSGRGFKDRVWPQARAKAGLPPKGLPGRKQKLAL